MAMVPHRPWLPDKAFGIVCIHIEIYELLCGTSVRKVVAMRHLERFR